VLRARTTCCTAETAALQRVTLHAESKSSASTAHSQRMPVASECGSSVYTHRTTSSLTTDRLPIRSCQGWSDQDREFDIQCPGATIHSWTVAGRVAQQCGDSAADHTSDHVATAQVCMLCAPPMSKRCKWLLLERSRDPGSSKKLRMCHRYCEHDHLDQSFWGDRYCCKRWLQAPITATPSRTCQRACIDDINPAHKGPHCKESRSTRCVKQIHADMCLSTASDLLTARYV
jgi:hypothetical protein